jgi:hypothetical protein
MVPSTSYKQAWEIIKNSKPKGVNVQPIINYFESTWINGRFEPATWIHFDDIGPRSNNHVEALNRVINTKLMKAHPNIWKFIDFIKSLDNQMKLALSQTKILSNMPYYITSKTKEEKNKI